MENYIDIDNCSSNDSFDSECRFECDMDDCSSLHTEDLDLHLTDSDESETISVSSDVESVFECQTIDMHNCSSLDDLDLHFSDSEASGQRSVCLDSDAESVGSQSTVEFYPDSLYGPLSVLSDSDCRSFGSQCSTVLYADDYDVNKDDTDDFIQCMIQEIICSLPY
jgi:hypothetical protein